MSLALVACNAGGVDPKESPNEEPSVGTSDFEWDGNEMRLHRDAPAGLRFLVPATGYRVTATHFELSTPPVKMKHSITLSEDRSEVLRIEVWDNVERLSLADWFQRYLDFMRAPDAVVESTHAARAGGDAIVILQPRSPQALARRSAVLALGPRVVRLTCIDDANPRFHALYERVFLSLEADGVR